MALHNGHLQTSAHFPNKKLVAILVGLHAIERKKNARTQVVCRRRTTITTFLASIAVGVNDFVWLELRLVDCIYNWAI